MKKDDLTRFVDAANAISRSLQKLAQIPPLSAQSTYVQTADTTRNVISIYAAVSADIIRFLVLADRILDAINLKDQSTRELFLAQIESCRSDARKLTDISCAIEDLILDLCNHLDSRIREHD